MEVNKRHACGFLRFFKRDGTEGSMLPLENNKEYTIGYDSQATIRLKTSKSTLKPIQCVIKIDANGFAKLINKDIAHAVKLNNKALYSSKYLLPNDIFFVLDKKMKYENQVINKNNLVKLSSRNKMSTPLKSSLLTRGRKSYTDMARKRSPNVLDGQTESVIAFTSLKGSKTPHVKKRLECFSTLSEKAKDRSLSPLNPQGFYLKTPLPEIKIHEVQSARSIESKRTPSKRCSINKNPISFCMTSSSGSEETHTGFHVSPFATKLDDLNTPPNNKSIIEINLTPFPSAKKRKSQKFVVTDDLEPEETKTPKTTSHFRNSLHLFSERKSRKSSLSNALSSISENIEPTKKFGQSLITSPNNELPTPPATKRVSSTLISVITPRNATPKLNETYSEEDGFSVKERKSEIKLNETYSEEDLSSGNEEEASVRKSRVKLNETYSENLSSEKQRKQTSSARNSMTENDDSPSVTKQKQTPNADEKAQVQRPVARKSLRKLNKTLSDADFSSTRERQQIYSPALVKRRFSNFVETALTSDQNSSTPILSRNLQPLTVKRPLRQSSVTENLNSPIFKVSPRSSISNITFRRPLRNVTSTYRLSQENIMLIDSDLEHSQNSPRGSTNVTSQENSFSEKAEPVRRSDSMSKGIQSPLEKSFTQVFHSSPIIKKKYSLNEDESSEESSLVKQLTLVLSDEDLTEMKVEDELNFKVNVDNLKSYSGPKKKRKKSSLLSSENSTNSSLKSNNTGSPSLLETTRSSSFYYQRPSSLFAQENNTFSDLLNISSKSKMSTPKNETKIEQNSAVKRTSKTPKNSLSDSRATTKDQVTDLTNVKSVKETPLVNRSPKNDLTDVAGVKRLLKTPRPRKEVKNDLSDVRGVRKLMATPKIERSPLNDLTQVKGLKKFMRTPKPIKSPKNDLSDVAGVRRLMESPREHKEPENDLSDVRGVRRLMSTPKERRSPLNDLTDVRGMKSLLRTPKLPKSPVNDLSDVYGVRDLMRTPKYRKSPDLSGIEDLMMTPVFNTTTSSIGEASTAEMGDFDALLNKKPVRTYRGKSRSPFKSPKTSDNNDYVQPNVAKWVEEQDNYLQSHSKEIEKTGAIKAKDYTPNKEEINLKSRTKTMGQQDTDKIESADLSPQFRTTRRRQKGIQVEEVIKTTRSKIKQQIAEEDTNTAVIEQSTQNSRITRSRNRNNREAVEKSKDGDLEELAQDIKTTRNKRTRRNKQTELDVSKDVEVEQTAKEIKSPRNRRLPKSKQEVEENVPKSAENVEEAKTGRSLRSKPQIKEKDSKDGEAVQETRATRSRRVPKSKQQIEDVATDEDDVQEMMPTRIRRLLTSKAQTEEESSNNDEVEKTKSTRNRRLPKNKQQIEDDSKDNGVDQPDTEMKITENDNEDIQVDLAEAEDKLPNNKGQGTRVNTRSRRHGKEEKGPSPKLLRTRKRKPEDTAEQTLIKKAKKIVSFDIDSPRRSNRTPRKLYRIADEEFEFDVDKISVGHSNKATKKLTEKTTVEEDAATPQEPRRSKRTRK